MQVKLYHILGRSQLGFTQLTRRAKQRPAASLVLGLLLLATIGKLSNYGEKQETRRLRESGRVLNLGLRYD